MNSIVAGSVGPPSNTKTSECSGAIESVAVSLAAEEPTYFDISTQKQVFW